MIRRTVSIQEASEIYEGIVAAKEFSAVVRQDIADLHWILAHAVVYYRGSATISEALTMGLCLRFGQNVQWLLRPELMAYALDRESFVKTFFQDIAQVSSAKE